MKRFIVFGYDRYYPTGAKQEMMDSFDTKEEVDNFLKEERSDYMAFERYDVLDCEKREWL